MFTGMNWEIIYLLERVNGVREPSQPEYLWDKNKHELTQYLKIRTKEVTDQYDLKTVEAKAVQIDKLDKGAGLVFYSTPADIVTIKHENAQ